MYRRTQLRPRDRQLITLGMLTALGGCEPQLDVHINASLNVGLTPVEIVEALLHVAVYCGMPKSLNATFVAKRVFAERELLPVKPGSPTGAGAAARELDAVRHPAADEPVMSRGVDIDRGSGRCGGQPVEPRRHPAVDVRVVVSPRQGAGLRAHRAAETGRPMSSSSPLRLHGQEDLDAPLTGRSER
jgi:hypothetical protein